jgi:hypothetical protein
VVDIKVNRRISAGDDKVCNSVITKINKVFGIGSPNSLANHVMDCLPSGVMTVMTTAVYAFVGSWNSVYSNKKCNYVSAVSPLINLETQHDGRSARVWMKRV